MTKTTYKKIFNWELVYSLRGLIHDRNGGEHESTQAGMTFEHYFSAYILSASWKEKKNIFIGAGMGFLNLQAQVQ